MNQTEPQPKQRKPSRLTFAPLYLAAGLVVCYMVLTLMVPSLAGVTEGGFQKQDVQAEGWHGFTLRLSAWTRQNSQLAIASLVVVSIAGFVVTFLFRAARYLVWLVALGVFFLTLALVAGSYGRMLSTLLKEAGGLDR